VSGAAVNRMGSISCTIALPDGLASGAAWMCLGPLLGRLFLQHLCRCLLCCWSQGPKEEARLAKGEPAVLSTTMRPRLTSPCSPLEVCGRWRIGCGCFKAERALLALMPGQQLDAEQCLLYGLRAWLRAAHRPDGVCCAHQCLHQWVTSCHTLW